jgi:hypothetical protein
VKAVNLAARFLLELCALATFAVAGAQLQGVVLAIALPLVAAVAWGRWAAPKAQSSRGARLTTQSVVLGGAAAVLAAAGHIWIAAALAAAIAINSVLLVVLD